MPDFDCLQEVRQLHRDLVANPAPLGLYAFGFTTALLQGANTGITDGGLPAGVSNTLGFVWGYGMFFGGLAQLLAGMWEFKKQNTFGATAFSSYGAFWMGLALWGILFSTKVVSFDPSTFAMVLSLWGIFTFIMMFPTLNLNVCLTSLFLTLSILFWILAAGQFYPTTPDHPSTTLKAAGGFGYFVAAIAWYIATAELMNEIYGTVVMPLGKWKLGSQILGLPTAPAPAPAPRAEEA